MKSSIHTPLLLLSLYLFACESIDTLNQNNPARDNVIASGKDLQPVLDGGYETWWNAVHGEVPVMALSVAADAYGLGWDDFGARRMGSEPREGYTNRESEEPGYKEIAEGPWYGCLSAASSANDVLAALRDGITIDDGGGQDQSVRAAAHFLRGASWGYLGLIFDQALLVDENTDLEQMVPFSDYPEVIGAAVEELDEAISLAEAAGDDFIHTSFNGLTLDAEQFVQLCHSYAARFLAQWPRTHEENETSNWQAVLEHAERGLSYDFAPLADGRYWKSYQQYAFAETGKGPFWARADQRLVAAMDPGQPARYPEVEALGEAPLASPMAQSADKRLQTDFVFAAAQAFPASHGEWHFSHYLHNRNISEPGFAGDGATFGPMPVFLAADNALLRAEALLELGRTAEAVELINLGARSSRGQLPGLAPGASPVTAREAIMYERAIELLSTAPMNLWFDRRRTGPRLPHNMVDALGGLQTGTPAQLPVPESELKVHGLPPYGFGGEKDPGGVDRVY